jgi:hypothetical protein
MPPSATLPRPDVADTPAKTPAPPKPKALTFARLKPHLKELPPEALIALIERLHGLNTTNKFLLAGTFEPTAPIHSKEMATLKARLQRLLNPKSYHREARVSEALALMKEYQKTNDELGLFDLCLTFAETVVTMLKTDHYRGYGLTDECEEMIASLVLLIPDNTVAINRNFKQRLFNLRNQACNNADDLGYVLVQLHQLFSGMDWQEEAEAERPWPVLNRYHNLIYKGRPLMTTAMLHDNE